MIRSTLLLTGFLLLSPSAWCQKTETETQTQTMQEVLLEIRQLRHDLQTAAVAARRAQILIFRLHEQQMIVDRATEKLQNTKDVRMQMERQRESEEVQIKNMEEAKDRSDSEISTRESELWLTQARERVGAIATQEQEWRARELEEEADVQAARSKLEQFESELDQLERDLEQTAMQAKNR
jgi:hypothetical protein